MFIGILLNHRKVKLVVFFLFNIFWCSECVLSYLYHTQSFSYIKNAEVTYINLWTLWKNQLRHQVFFAHSYKTKETSKTNIQYTILVQCNHVYELLLRRECRKRWDPLEKWYTLLRAGLNARPRFRTCGETDFLCNNYYFRSLRLGRA